MGLKTWAREQVFKRVADALESPSIGGSFLGWDMGNWKLWLEGAGVAVGAAVLGALADSVQSGQPFTIASFKSTAMVAGLTALVAYLRKSPTDPRRPEVSATPGQVIDIASRAKEDDVVPEWKKIGEIPEVKVIPKVEVVVEAPKTAAMSGTIVDFRSKAVVPVGTRVLLPQGAGVVMLTKESSSTGFTYAVRMD